MDLIFSDFSSALLSSTSASSTTTELSGVPALPKCMLLRAGVVLFVYLFVSQSSCNDAVWKIEGYVVSS